MSYETTQVAGQQTENNEALSSSVGSENQSTNEPPEEVEVTTEEALLEIATQTMANNIVKNHVIASIAVGLVPIPLFDLSGLVATQMNMLSSLSVHYDVPFNDMDSKSLITSLVGGSLPVVGVLGLSSFTKLIPGIGSLAGSASLSVTAGAVTYAVGQVFIMHFEEGGTFDDFNPGQAQAYFKREFEAGKSFVVTLREEIKAAKASKTAEADKSEAES